MSMSEHYASEDELGRSAQYASEDELGRSAATKHDQKIVRLADLFIKLAENDDRKRALRNIFKFVQNEFPNESLPIMHRLSRWDQSGTAAFLYARAAFEIGQPKLAHKLILPQAERSEAPDQVLLLAARTCLRLNDRAAAHKFLARISDSSKLSQGVSEVREKLEASDDSNASEASI
jgi:hypothetical protein